MLLNEFIWSVFRPWRFLPGDNRVVLERDGVTETEGSGWEDGRPERSGYRVWILLDGVEGSAGEQRHCNKTKTW